MKVTSLLFFGPTLLLNISDVGSDFWDAFPQSIWGQLSVLSDWVVAVGFLTNSGSCFQFPKSGYLPPLIE